MDQVGYLGGRRHTPAAASARIAIPAAAIPPRVKVRRVVEAARLHAMARLRGGGQGQQGTQAQVADRAHRKPRVRS